LKIVRAFRAVYGGWHVSIACTRVMTSHAWSHCTPSVWFWHMRAARTCIMISHAYSSGSVRQVGQV